MSSIFKKLKYYFLGTLFLGAFFVWYVILAETRSGLKVSFLDVGQGDAIFVEAPNGNQILIDGGPNKAVIRELAKQMPFYDRSIDGVVLTHPHLDHYGGLIDAMDNFKINFEIDSGNNNSESKGFDVYLKKLEEKTAKRFFAKRGMRVNLGGGVYLDVLLPVINKEDMPAHDEMVVMRLVYGNNSFLLTGDMEDGFENFLIFLDGERLKSDVLKIGHHGSLTSTSESFLGWVKPNLAIISVGKNNKYGHPKKEITDRLAKFEIPALRTDEVGTIVIESDGEKIMVE